MIPALFLLTCLSMRHPWGDRPIFRCAIWGSSLALILAVVTNDLHHGMFRPVGEMRQGGGWGTYETGPLWTAVYIFLGVYILLGLILLAWTDRQRKSGRRTLPPAFLLLLTFLLMYLFGGIIENYGFSSPYTFPEIFTFGMLGIFESCTRSRLIPSKPSIFDLRQTHLFTPRISGRG